MVEILIGLADRHYSFFEAIIMIIVGLISAVLFFMFIDWLDKVSGPIITITFMIIFLFILLWLFLQTAWC